MDSDPLDDVELSERGDALTFALLVAPRASRSAIGPVIGDRVRVAVTAPPVGGKANEAVVALLADGFGVRKRDVEIVGGATGKRKTVRVAGASLEGLRELLLRGGAAKGKGR